MNNKKQWYLAVGREVGLLDGWKVGDCVGFLLGTRVGLFVVGFNVGFAIGTADEMEWIQKQSTNMAGCHIIIDVFIFIFLFKIGTVTETDE